MIRIEGNPWVEVLSIPWDLDPDEVTQQIVLLHEDPRARVLRVEEHPDTYAEALRVVCRRLVHEGARNVEVEDPGIVLIGFDSVSPATGEIDRRRIFIRVIALGEGPPAPSAWDRLLHDEEII